MSQCGRFLICWGPGLGEFGNLSANLSYNETDVTFQSTLGLQGQAQLRQKRQKFIIQHSQKTRLDPGFFSH